MLHSHLDCRKKEALCDSRGRLALIAIVLVASAAIAGAFAMTLEGDEISAADPTFTWDEGSKTLTVTCSGPMPNYTQNAAPWFSYWDKATKIAIVNCTNIGNYAFHYFRSVTEVTMDKPPTSIGDYAFSSCIKMPLIDLSEATTLGDGAFTGCKEMEGTPNLSKVTSIGRDAFRDCAKLSGSLTVYAKTIGSFAFRGCDFSSITIPAEMDSLGDGVFQECKSITGFVLPTNLSFIGQSIFKDCINLASVYIPNNYTDIDIEAFSGCSELTTVTGMAGIKTLGAKTFMDCSKLNSVPLGSNLETIDYSAFQNCSVLETLSIPSGVTTIGNDAFNGCAALTSITIPTGVTEIGNGTFDGCTSLTSITIQSTLASLGDTAFPEHTFYDDATVLDKTKENLSTSKFTGTVDHMSLVVHTATFSVGSGSAPAPADITAGELRTITLPEYSGTIPSMKFLGWTYGTTTYKPGDGAVMGSSDMAFTAKWATVHNVTYDIDGGSGDAPTEVPMGETEEFTVKGYTGTKEDHRFDGWSCGTDTFVAGDTATMGTSDMTFTAIWTLIPKHSVTYDIAGGSGDAPTQDPVPEGGSFTVADYTGTKTDYSFDGWSYESGTYTPGDTVTMGTSDMTFTAIWTLIPKHSVTYNIAGGSGEAPTQEDVQEGASFTVADYTGTKEDHRFDGWTCGSDTYKPGDTVTMGTENMGFTAIWTFIPKHSVTYDIAGGSGDAPTQDPVPEGGSFTVADYTGTKEDYRFTGWVCDGVPYAPGKTVTMGTSDMEFTAVWIPLDKHTITYDVAGGCASRQWKASSSPWSLWKKARRSPWRNTAEPRRGSTSRDGTTGSRRTSPARSTPSAEPMWCWWPSGPP